MKPMNPKDDKKNEIYTIVKGRETFYRRRTVPVTSCSEVKYVLKRVSFGSKDLFYYFSLKVYALGQKQEPKNSIRSELFYNLQNTEV